MAKKPSTKRKSKSVIQGLLMVNIHVSYNGCSFTAKELSEKLAKDNDASKDMIRTSVKMVSPADIKLFTTAISRLRAYYKDNTLPWEDGNWRVVPVTKLQGFKDDIETLIAEVKDEFDKAFDKGYDDLRDLYDARKGKLSHDFPAKETILEDFNVSYAVGAPNSADDIRTVGIDKAMRSRIEKETEARYESQINTGLNDLTKNLQGAVKNIAERVESDDQKGKKYTRFIENLNQMTEVVESLNVTGNTTLTKCCEDIRENISCWSPEAIKSDPKVREKIRGSASGIDEQLSMVGKAFEDE